MTDRERCCFRFSIRPGSEGEYRKRHDELWPELEKAIVDAGFSNYTLFRSGTTIIAYCECDPSVSSAFARLGATEVNARWSESFAGIIVESFEDYGAMDFLEEVWHLD